MKQIIFLIMIIFLIGCGNPFKKLNPTPKPTPIFIPEITHVPVIPAMSTIEFALYDGHNLMYYDGENITHAYSGNIKKAGQAKLSIDNVLNYFDNYGNVTKSEWLSITPDAIVTKNNNSSSRAVVYDDDIWMLEHISPDVAYSLGGLYKDYTQIYYNNIPIGNWWDEIWNPKNIITTESGLILGIDNNNSYHNINGSGEVILKAYDNGIVIYDLNASSRTCKIADNEGFTENQWQYNYFNNCRWQEADGVWYASHGYEWSFENGLTEQANIMWNMNFQADYPVFLQLPHVQYASIITAGVINENGEDVCYWIECNRGTLFKFIPSINKVEFISRIYLGDNTRNYGANQVNVLKPIWSKDKIYFHHDGSIKVFNPVTTQVEIFSDDMEIIEWK